MQRQSPNDRLIKTNIRILLKEHYVYDNNSREAHSLEKSSRVEKPFKIKLKLQFNDLSFVVTNILRYSNSI